MLPVGFRLRKGSEGLTGIRRLGLKYAERRLGGETGIYINGFQTLLRTCFAGDP
jgi:hypothetical protein